MPRVKNEPDELEMITAAYLAGENRPQTAIGKTLGMSQAAVSRLLAQARKRYLREELRFLQEKVSPEMMQRVLRRASRNSLNVKLEQLARRTGRRGPILRVFPCKSADRWERMRELSLQAAPYIRDLILRSKVCGVTWGGMLSRVVSAVEDLSMVVPWKDIPIEIIPLSGEPLGEDPNTYSSSSLAHQLGVAVNGDTYRARSLAMVPAFVPDQFAPEQISGVWRLIGLVKAHAEIFGKREEEPLAGKLDMVLTSVGPAERPLSFGVSRLFETGNLKLEELQNLVIGDMGGVCFERAGLTEEQQLKLKSVADRWTGWSRKDLDDCAARASAAAAFHGPPGIVVISIGADRAKFLLETAALGCVNHLLIDDELQVELERLLSNSPVDVKESPTR